MVSYSGLEEEPFCEVRGGPMMARMSVGRATQAGNTPSGNFPDATINGYLRPWTHDGAARFTL
jgi:hypothetical protein